MRVCVAGVWGTQKGCHNLAAPSDERRESWTHLCHSDNFKFYLLPVKTAESLGRQHSTPLTWQPLSEDRSLQSSEVQSPQTVCALHWEQDSACWEWSKCVPDSLHSSLELDSAGGCQSGVPGGEPSKCRTPDILLQ